MAEENEGREAGAEGPVAGIDPAAAALALNGASQAKADAFLDKQNSLIDIQKHHLREQFKQLRLGIWQLRMGVLLRLATMAMGLAVAGALSWLVWDASQSNGLVIERFSVPPDLAQRGLTGEVVAARILDHISAMESQTLTARAPKSYANSWTRQDLKIEIPETGLSLSQLDEFLREKLGHDTHVTGEIVHTPQGLSLTARAGTEGAESVTGSENDVDALIQRLSESVYGLTQPFRYGAYLGSHGRSAESVPILRALVASGPASERAWGYIGWGLSVTDSDGMNVNYDLSRRAAALAPDNFLTWSLLSRVEDLKGLAEQALLDRRKIASLLDNGTDTVMEADLSVARMLNPAEIDISLGAYHDATQAWRTYLQSGLAVGRPGLTADFAFVQAGEHDLAAARATLAQPLPEVTRSVGQRELLRLYVRLLIDRDSRSWSVLLADAGTIEPLLPRYPGLRTYLPTVVTPLTAYAEARLGHTAKAEKEISTTPADCYQCLIARAEISETEGQTARADWWFGRAVAAAPSIPFAYHRWGLAQLARGELDPAIENFKSSNRKGPQFADALEGWGEALVKKDRSDLALAKFSQADKYAPNWGKLHLKWGEALGYAGHKDEARKQYQAASTLDLSVADKAELASRMQGKV